MRDIAAQREVKRKDQHARTGFGETDGHECERRRFPRAAASDQANLRGAGARHERVDGRACGEIA